MKTKLVWFYQDMLDTEAMAAAEPSKPSTSRQLQPSTSRANLQPNVTPIYKKKLFLTDGWDIPLTGICIYIFRTNSSKQLPEEGFQKVLLFFLLKNVVNICLKLLTSLYTALDRSILR